MNILKPGTTGVFVLTMGNMILKLLSRLLFVNLEHSPDSILVIRTGNLGDSWCALPALEALKHRYPQARIAIATAAAHHKNPHSAQIFREIGGWQNIILYDPTQLRTIKGIRDLRKRLRQEKFDLVVYLGQSSSPWSKIIRDLFFFRWTGITRAVGFRWNKPIISGKIISLPRPLPDEVTRLLELLAPLKINPNNVIWPKITTIPVCKTDQPGHPLIAVHPTAKFPAKRWDPEKMLKAIELVIREKPQVIFVVIGDILARPFAQKASSLLGEEHVIDLSGKTSFSQLASLLNQVDILLSLDSGPVHVAAAQNTPVVGIYSARDWPGAWHPHGSGHVVLRTDLPCGGCLKTQCSTMECLQAITPEMAATSVLNILE